MNKEDRRTLQEVASAISTIAADYTVTNNRFDLHIARLRTLANIPDKPSKGSDLLTTAIEALDAAMPTLQDLDAALVRLISEAARLALALHHGHVLDREQAR